MTKLIFALDTCVFGTNERLLLQDIAESVDVVKIGLELMTAENERGESFASQARRFVIDELGKEVMWDMKILDVKNTMEKAAINICRYGSRFFTLHAHASEAALEAVAVAAGTYDSVPLAVTVLTDLDDPQCRSRFVDASSTTVDRFATIALGQRIRGFVCSAKEAPIISQRAVFMQAPSFTIVTPGIRPVWAVAPDEQKRVTTPVAARQAGAHYAVVGRPISSPPKSVGSSKRAAQLIKEELTS